MNVYQQAASRIFQSNNVVALTGAGISVESGIPDFRSADGLWSRYDPIEFGHIHSFLTNPAKVWKMLLEIDNLLSRAEPNPAHYALVDLERRGILRGVITQNIDSLHQKAGSRCVVEYHGHGRTLRCIECGENYPRGTLSLDSLPPKCRCGGILRPNFVFFGEAIPDVAHRHAVSLVSDCDVLLIVGTSASVAPASYLPIMAKDGGGIIIDINPGRSELSSGMIDIHIAAPAGKALPALLEAIDRLLVAGKGEENERKET